MVAFMYLPDARFLAVSFYRHGGVTGSLFSRHRHVRSLCCFAVAGYQKIVRSLLVILLGLTWRRSFNSLQIRRVKLALLLCCFAALLLCAWGDDATLLIVEKINIKIHSFVLLRDVILHNIFV